MKSIGRGLALVALALALALVACKKTPAPAPEKPCEAAKAEKAAEPTKAAAVEEKAPSAADIVARAIEASGGAAALEKNLSAMTAEYTGMYMGSPYTATSYWQAPDKFFMAINDESFSMAHVGPECWYLYGDVVVDCPPGEGPSGERMTRIGHLMHLYPLAKGDWTLEKVDDTKLGEKDCASVRISGGTLKAPVTFHFDKKSGLLAGASYEIEAMGQTMAQQIEVKAVRQEAGIQIMSVVETTMGGKPMMTEELGKAQFGVVDAARFERPPKPELGKISVATRPAAKVVSTTVTGPYEKAIGPGLGTLMGWLTKNGAFPMGPPSMLWIKDPTQTENPAEYVTELQVPLASLEALPEPPEGVVVKELPAGEIVRCVDVGPPDKVSVRYGELAKWAVENGYQLQGPAAMDSFGDPATTPPDKMVSVLWFPVAKKEAAE